MIYIDIFVFLLKIFIISLAAIVVAFIDFRRFKARYGKRTFFQFYFRYARAETEAEDPTHLFILKSGFALIWMAVFGLILFG